MSAAAPRTILLTGVNGQVGFELQRSLQGLGTVVALDRHALDLDNAEQIRRVVREVKPSLIVNPAAYRGHIERFMSCSRVVRRRPSPRSPRRPRRTA